MLWILLLLAAAVMVLISTDRLESVDCWLAKFFRKLSLAWAYLREDCEDLELEIREEARAAKTVGRGPMEPDSAAAPEPPETVESGSSRH